MLEVSLLRSRNGAPSRKGRAVNGQITKASNKGVRPAPTMQLHSNPIAVPGSGHTRKQINSFDAVIHMQGSPPHKRFLAGFMRLAECLTALRA